jgi:quercetin dioxygenase-like cupin family protein
MFETGNNTETLTVLEGELEASVNQGPVSTLARDGTIIAPAGTKLGFTTGTDKVFYICRYTPKISPVNDT